MTAVPRPPGAGEALPDVPEIPGPCGTPGVEPDPGGPLRRLRRRLARLVRRSAPYRAFVTRRSLARHRGRPGRRLEIGPGHERLPGFETLDVLGGRHVDYPVDAAGPLPFADDTFEIVYASHVLEHVPWYLTERVLAEWVRVLGPGGALEIWVPDGLRIARTLVRFEDEGVDGTDADGWYRFNPDRDPCRWAAGRIFTYGDGTGETCHPNWHRALFTPRYLRKLMEGAGLTGVREMRREEVRGYDHGWINLGVRGVKA